MDSQLASLHLTLAHSKGHVKVMHTTMNRSQAYMITVDMVHSKDVNLGQALGRLQFLMTCVKMVTRLYLNLH